MEFTTAGSNRAGTEEVHTPWSMDRSQMCRHGFIISLCFLYILYYLFFLPCYPFGWTPFGRSWIQWGRICTAPYTLVQYISSLFWPKPWTFFFYWIWKLDPPYFWQQRISKCHDILIIRDACKFCMSGWSMYYSNTHFNSIATLWDGLYNQRTIFHWRRVECNCPV